MMAAAGASASEVAHSFVGEVDVLRADAAEFVPVDSGGFSRDDATAREALLDAVLRLPSDPATQRQELVLALNAFAAARRAAGVDAGVAKHEASQALADIREAMAVQSAKDAEEVVVHQVGDVVAGLKF